MSVIVGVNYGGDVAIACDSLWEWEGRVTHRNVAKVAQRDFTGRHKGRLLMSVNSTAGFEDIFWPKIEKLIGEHGSDWLPKWTDACAFSDTWQKQVADKHSGPVLVAWRLTRGLKPHLAAVWPSGATFETTDPVLAIAAGAPFATGAAMALIAHDAAGGVIASDLKAGGIARIAAEVTCDLSMKCERPVQVYML